MVKLDINLGINLIDFSIVLYHAFKNNRIFQYLPSTGDRALLSTAKEPPSTAAKAICALKTTLCLGAKAIRDQKLSWGCAQAVMCY